MEPTRNVLFITLDQWRGDGISLLGHPVLQTKTLDQLARRGTIFKNHWANAAPCGPSRACLYTGTYLHRNRSVLNGTPLSQRFTNIALLARDAGYDPVLFGYTDTSIDPSTVPKNDPALYSYEGILPGFRPIVHDPFEAKSPMWAKWLAKKGIDVPSNPHDLYLPDTTFPGATTHGSTWAPTRFSSENSETSFMVEQITHYLDQNGDKPFFIHASFIRPHPPRRNPPGYHDLYDANDVDDPKGAQTKEQEAAIHPLAAIATQLPRVGAPNDEGEKRQMRATYYGAQHEVDDKLEILFSYLRDSGLFESTLIVLTSDHGEMGGDHWLFEKLGYWDESYHIPLIIFDPYTTTSNNTVEHFTESVDIVPTICEWLGIEKPLQCDGFSLTQFINGQGAPSHWRSEAHFEWDFRSPSTKWAESILQIPMAHCGLNVIRSATTKYVAFGTDQDKLPPLIFDLQEDPNQIYDLVANHSSDAASIGWEYSNKALQWRMRNDERLNSGQFLSPSEGLIEERDAWW
ncbi:sulfatase-like hydrolase/transferase [Acidithrix sp. C25]|uniref:sulfatase-like hydrolase/transferase n=1 Tax=Acidithrix sp. C25 TaxID=1671482 RepID=UPI000AF67923|nr:sulfatase-like hydrolase/transferase [Acidithrix sp. C25]CAG4926370.1 unnamed protein product [Acidithrix sp. C25]